MSDEMRGVHVLLTLQVRPSARVRHVLGISARPKHVEGLGHVLFLLAGLTAFAPQRDGLHARDGVVRRCSCK